MTPRQRDLYRFIVQYRVENGGVSPTVQEMEAALGLHSKSGVSRLLHALHRDGLVTWRVGSARSVQPLGPVAPLPPAVQELVEAARAVREGVAGEDDATVAVDPAAFGRLDVAVAELDAQSTDIEEADHG